jgi:hypothetical protein
MSDEYVPPSRDELIALGRELFEMGRGGGTFWGKASKVSQAQIPAVHAVARHTLELGDSAITLIESDREFAALTLMRSALECALTSVWLVQSDEAVFGFAAEEYRQRRAISAEMAKAVSESLREGATRIAHLDEESVETIASPQARAFQQLCNQFAGGNEAYLHYRIMSGMVHPCVTLTDFYLELDDDAPGGAALGMDPKPIGHDSWLFLTVASMMWAQRALDHLDSNHTQRSRLRGIAHELQVPETLSLTPEAQQAAAKSAQARRRAEWVGPKSRRQDARPAGEWRAEMPESRHDS